jgi:hypothetical protein
VRIASEARSEAKPSEGGWAGFACPGPVRSAWIIPTALSLGCSGGSLSFTGSPDKPIPVTILDALVVVDVTLDGMSGPRLVADSGAPVVVIDPAMAPAMTVPNGIGTVQRFGVGDVVIESLPVVGTNILGMGGSGALPIAGLMGCTVLCAFTPSFNYRDAQLTLGSGAPDPSNLEPGSSVGFRLLGGGEGMISGVSGQLTIPASRIIVQGTLEGMQGNYMVDTGASVMVIRQSIFNMLLQDGRGHLRSSDVSMFGISTSTIARLKSFSLGSVEVMGIIAAEDVSGDMLLDGIGKEVGLQIDGLVGGTFLREFYATLDYSKRSLGLKRYSSLDFLTDEGVRVGIAVVSQPGAHGRVQVVYPNTDAAAQGVSPGDIVSQIDGQDVSSLDDAAISSRLIGKLGTSHTILFGCPGCGGFQGTKTIKVDDLLKLPN